MSLFKGDEDEAVDSRHKHKTMVVRSQRFPVNLTPNDIDYTKSLHTTMLQRSEYMKLDDNLLNFDFDRSIFPWMKKTKRLTDQDIINKREDLNKVHCKYLSSDSVNTKNMFILGQKLQFMSKINRMKNKGDMILN